MHHFKGFVVLFGIIINAFQIQGVLEINLPPNKVGNFGETTLLNCTDTNFNILNGYNWFKDNVNIYNSANGDTTRKYKSSNGSDFFTLEISNTTLDDNGVYRCSHNFKDKSDTLSIQAKGTAEAKVEDSKLLITVTKFYPNTTTVSSVTCNGKIITGSSTTNASGDFFDLVWISASVDTNDLKAGCDIEMSSLVDYILSVGVDILGTTTSTTLSTASITTYNTHMSHDATSTQLSTTTKSRDNNTVIIIGVSVGSVFILIIIVGSCICINRRKNRQQAANDHDML